MNLAQGNLGLTASRISILILATYSGIVTSMPSTGPYGPASAVHGTLPYPASLPKKGQQSQLRYCSLAPIIFGAGSLDQ